MKLIRVTAVDFRKTEDEDDVLIQLAGRGEDGERHTQLVEDVIPYFYAREDEAPLVVDEDGVREVRDGYQSFDGVPLSRIDVKVPGNSGERSPEKNITEEFEQTWESDIPFYRRASIDYDLTGHIRVPETDRCSIDDIETDVEVAGDDIIEPRVLIADIEVLPKDGTDFETMTEEYNSPITHISMWDSQADEYIALHLDEGGFVNTTAVGEYLDAHIAGERLLEERERDITIRAYDSEEKLLSGFLSVIEERRPDLTSGWNWVDFDWDYILGRFDAIDSDNLNEHRLSDIGWISGYQTERRVDCLPAFDMMSAYTDKMSFSEWRSSALDYVAKSELGVGKLPDVSVSWGYDNARNELLAYNIMDTMLCVALDRKEGIHEFFYELAELSQVQIYDTMSEMRLVDGYLMSQASDDEILPTMKEKDIPENAGGLVLDPSDGVREWVGVLDLKSLYPSVIITWNISPETINWYDDDAPTGDHINIPWLPDADHAEGGRFTHDEIDFDVMWTDMDEVGLIPKYIRRLFPERAKRKEARSQYKPGDELYDVWDRKQSAVKVIMNSFYGVMSNDYWRLGQYGLGDAVTSAARYALWQGKEIGQDEGYEIYYGDTDSIMLSLADPGEGKQDALDRGHDLEEVVNERMHECVEHSGLDGKHPFLSEDLHGTEYHTLVYEFEKLYRRFFQAGSKKRYAGSIVWKEGKDDDDIDTVGFESQRSDSPELTEVVQPEVIDMILSGGGFEEVSEYVTNLIEEIEEREMELYKVAIPKSLGKPLPTYGNTQTARACRYSNDHLNYHWTKGDDPWMYFVRKTPPMTPDTDVLCLEWDEELPEGYELDLEETLDRALKGPLQPILREVGWRWAEVKQGAQTQSAAEASWTVDDSSDEDNGLEDDDWGW